MAETEKKNRPTPKQKTSNIRDKSLNTPEFNLKAKIRRKKAKHDAINRKKNRKK